MSDSIDLRAQGADLVLVGGRVMTVDAAFRIAQAVAIRGDRILAVGSDAEIERYTAPRARRIALDGRTVVPGLIDVHAHLDREGLKAVCPSLAGARSIDDILQRIEVLTRQTEPGQWIVTMPTGDPPSYFDVPQCLREQRVPTRWELDRVSPRHPVYIRAIWGYWRHTLPLVSVANSRALAAAGITRETVPPSDGIQIDKDPASGEPTGIFVERTYMPLVELTLMRVAPRFTHAQRVEGLRRSMQVYAATGTTSVFEGHGVAPEVQRAYKALAERGELGVRAELAVSPSWGTAGAPPAGTGEGWPGEFLDSWLAWLAGRGLGDDWLRIAGLVAETDQTPDNALRAQARPYTGWAGFCYDAALPRDRVRQLLVAAARADIRIASMSTALLGLYAEVDREIPIRDKRWVIGHISTLTDDEVSRIRDLGLVLSTHTNRYLHKEGELLRRRLDPGGEASIVPLQTLKQAGVHVALATDNVPTSLFHPVWHVVSRIDRLSGAAVAPAQCLSREDALRAATIEGAYLTRSEREKGSIEPGKLADVVVLSDDPLTCEEERLKDIVAELTVVGGRIVFDRSADRSTGLADR